MDLHDACENGNVNRVVELLSLSDWTALDKDIEGRTPLHVAALSGQLDIVRLLLGVGDGDGEAHKVRAVSFGSATLEPATLESKVEQKERVSLPPQKVIAAKDFNTSKLIDQYGNSPLFCCCLSPSRAITTIPGKVSPIRVSVDSQIAKLLISCGDSIHGVKAETKMTLLHWACFHGDVTLVELLLDPEYGGVCNPIQWCESTGECPLDMAAHRALDLQEAVELARKRPLSVRTPRDFKTIFFNHHRVVTCLVKHGVAHLGKEKELGGANSSQVKRYRQHLLFWAARFDHRDLVATLLEWSDLPLDPLCICTIRHGVWGTPVHAAAAAGHAEVLRLLIEDPDFGGDAEAAAEELGEKKQEQGAEVSGEGGALLNQSPPLSGDGSAETKPSSADGATTAPTADAGTVETPVAGHAVLSAMFGGSGGGKRKGLTLGMALRVRSAAKRARSVVRAHSGHSVPLHMLAEWKDSELNSPYHLTSSAGHTECLKLLLVHQPPIDIRGTNREGWEAVDLVRTPEALALFQLHRPETAPRVGDVVGDTGPYEPDYVLVLPRGGALLEQQRQSIVDAIAAPSNQAPALTVVDSSSLPFDLHNPLRGVPIHRCTKCGGECGGSGCLRPSATAADGSSALHRFHRRVSFLPCASVLPTDLLLIRVGDEALRAHAELMRLRMPLLHRPGNAAFKSAEEGDFQPFRSRHRQLVTLDIIKRKFDVQKYINKGVVQQIFPVHNRRGCERILSRWVRDPVTGKKAFPPLGHLWEYFSESRTNAFESLTLLRAYFGCKMALYYAFLEFYTAWLMALVVPGVALQVVQLVVGSNIITVCYAVLVALWATIMVEKWKRKRSEVCVLWGLDVDNDSPTMERSRPEFLGDENINPATRTVEKYYPPTWRASRSALSLSVLTAMIGVVVVAFAGVVQIKALGRPGDWRVQFLGATINGSVITAMNALYKRLAVLFTHWENHRTPTEHDTSLALKTFAFQFVNSYLSLFWAAFVHRDFQELELHLIGLVVTRQAIDNVNEFILPSIKYRFALWRRGFARGGFLAQTAAASALLHKHRDSSDSVQALPAASVTPLQPSASPTAATLVPEDSTAAAAGVRRRTGKVAPDVGCRGIPESTPLQQKQQPWTATDTDAPATHTEEREGSEANRRPLTSEEWQSWGALHSARLQEVMEAEESLVADQVEIVMQFGYVTMFSTAFPAAALFSFLNNLFEIRGEVSARCSYGQRSPADDSRELRVFMTILEFMSFAAVAVNCALLFFTSTELHIVPSVTQRLWLLVAAEHVVIGLKSLVAALVPDQPRWVHDYLSRQHHLAAQKALKDELNAEKNNAASTQRGTAASAAELLPTSPVVAVTLQAPPARVKVKSLASAMLRKAPGGSPSAAAALALSSRSSSSPAAAMMAAAKAATPLVPDMIIEQKREDRVAVPKTQNPLLPLS